MYRYRFVVIGVMVALCLGAGIFGISLGKHVTQSGFFDDSSQSVKAVFVIEVGHPPEDSQVGWMPSLRNPWKGITKRAKPQHLACP